MRVINSVVYFHSTITAEASLGAARAIMVAIWNEVFIFAGA